MKKIFNFVRFIDSFQIQEFYFSCMEICMVLLDVVSDIIMINNYGYNEKIY